MHQKADLPAVRTSSLTAVIATGLEGAGLSLKLVLKDSRQIHKVIHHQMLHLKAPVETYTAETAWSDTFCVAVKTYLDVVV